MSNLYVPETVKKFFSKADENPFFVRVNNYIIRDSFIPYSQNAQNLGIDFNSIRNNWPKVFKFDNVFAWQNIIKTIKERLLNDPNVSEFAKQIIPDAQIKILINGKEVEDIFIPKEEKKDLVIDVLFSPSGINIKPAKSK